MNRRFACRTLAAAVALYLLLVFTPLTNRLYAWLEVKPDLAPADATVLLTAET